DLLLLLRVDLVRDEPLVVELLQAGEPLLGGLRGRRSGGWRRWRGRARRRLRDDVPQSTDELDPRARRAIVEDDVAARDLRARESRLLGLGRLDRGRGALQVEVERLRVS